MSITYPKISGSFKQFHYHFLFHEIQESELISSSNTETTYSEIYENLIRYHLFTIIKITIL